MQLYIVFNNVEISLFLAIIVLKFVHVDFYYLLMFLKLLEELQTV